MLARALGAILTINSSERLDSLMQRLDGNRLRELTEVEVRNLCTLEPSGLVALAQLDVHRIADDDLAVVDSYTSDKLARHHRGDLAFAAL